MKDLKIAQYKIEIEGYGTKEALIRNLTELIEGFKNNPLNYSVPADYSHINATVTLTNNDENN